MQHFRRITDERVGLFSAFVVLLSYMNKWDMVGWVFSAFLVVFFLFRLSIGKPHVGKKRK